MWMVREENHTIEILELIEGYGIQIINERKTLNRSRGISKSVIWANSEHKHSDKEPLLGQGVPVWSWWGFFLISVFQMKC